MATDEVHMIPVTGDIDKIIEVGRELSKGKTARAVGAEMGMTAREAQKLGEQYRSLTLQMAKSNQNFADRLVLSLEESLQHFDMLLKDAWENKEDATLNQEFSVVNSTLRLIKDLTESRFKMLHAMTEGQDAELMIELEEMSERQDELVGILKELKDKYPDAARFVARRLGEVRGIQVV